MRIVATLVSLVLAGCATAAAQRDLGEYDRRLAQARAVQDEADEEVQRAWRQWCREHPGDCRPRRLLERLPDGSLQWYETGFPPPLRSVLNPIREEAIRRRARLSASNEVEFALSRLLAEQWEAGNFTDD